METSKKDSPKLPGTKEISKLWGFFFLILGIAGLLFGFYAVFYYVGNIVPLFGSVIAGALVGALSILILIYGFRIIIRDI